jgi:hypothetical protein
MAAQKVQYQLLGRPLNVDLNVNAQVSLRPDILTMSKPEKAQYRLLRVDVLAPEWMQTPQPSDRKSVGRIFAEMVYRIVQSGFDAYLPSASSPDGNPDFHQSVLMISLPHGIPLKPAVEALAKAIDPIGSGVAIDQNELYATRNPSVPVHQLRIRIDGVTGGTDNHFPINPTVINRVLQGATPAQQPTQAPAS